MDKQFFVYIMTTYSRSAIYTGMTNDLVRRVSEHKNEINTCFTSKYKVNRLVYYEIFNDPYNAIEREKMIKGWTRRKKINLISSFNPNWEDLIEKIID